MKKSLQLATLCTVTAISTITFAAQKPISVGVLAPIEIPAMTQIVSGFKKGLTESSKTPIHFVVKNAQGNINIQRSILQEFNTSDVKVIAPIGTDAAQMAMAMVHNKPIVGIAADHVKENAKKANNLEVTGVNSRVPPAQRLDFIHAVLPNIKKITLIYSASAHIFPQVKQVENAGKKIGITVQPLMVTQLSNLYSISKSIAPNSQAIFILKDEMIVSGINTLLQQGKIKHIPVIASDDGSVGKGAAFALGVSEYQTGVDAGKVVAQILQGKKASDMPIHMMTHYFVFLNPASAQSQNVNPATVKMAAKKLGYKIQILS